MKLSIIIVSWNVVSHINDCINSIKNHSINCNYEIIIVDNASSDDTVEFISKNHPDVKLLANKENLGFGAANNQGAKVASGKYLFILNPDTLCQEGTITNLLEYAGRHPESGIIGPKLFNEDGSVQGSIRRFQTWKAVFCRYTPLKFFGVFKKDLALWRYRDFDYSKEASVEQLSGAALLIRKDLFDEHEGFDERFFMYYEEVDLCYRIVKSGRHNLYYPGAQLIHVGGRSSRQIPAGKQFMILQSLVKYLKKNAPLNNTKILSAAFKGGVLALSVHELLINAALVAVLYPFLSDRKRAKCKAGVFSAYDFIVHYYLRFIRTC